MFLNFNEQGSWYGSWNLIREMVEYTGWIPHHGSPRAIRKSTMMDHVVILGILRQLTRRMAM
jgi:hypothetical protein